MAIVAGDTGHIAAHNALDVEHTAWTAYSANLTASSVAPNIGTTGTTLGRYKQVGKTVFWRFQIAPGGTGITTGTGTWLVVWPAALSPQTTAAGPVGSGWIYNGSFYTVVATNFSASYMQFVLTSAAGYMASTNQPLSAAGHLLQAGGSYEIA